MELQEQNQKKQIKQGSIYDPKERERLLMQYQGIFKNNIHQYSQRVIKKFRKQKNFAR